MNKAGNHPSCASWYMLTVYLAWLNDELQVPRIGEEQGVTM
jgi:hypothetical protein